ncbi:CoA transferase [Acetobacter sacchari]|uniref:CoA transferase n=1 Tax=Acetobacter sacchari TaxID=2661687 RepID=A0ABS3M1H0_9PROT|nr:CoA transferase [Acetobacter sacchari]MBO1362003.1 CoA transferase [Acetobacter sacchari]
MIKEASCTTDAPLAGVRVVEIVEGAMSLTGRWLADFGADVLRVDVEEDSSVTSDDGTFVTHSGVEFLAWHRGKRALRINPSAPGDKTVLTAEIGRCDILIEDGRLASLFGQDFSADAFQQANPALVVLSISDFGADSPCATWRATDPVLHALAGSLSRSGIPGRAPLLPPNALATPCAAAQAAFVTMLAFFARLNSGRGDWLDFSRLDGVAQTLDPGFGSAGSAAAGVRACDLPRGRPDARNQYPIIRCLDGFVRLCILSPRQWRGMFKWMGSPAEFADPSYEMLTTRSTSDKLTAAIGAFFMDKTRSQLEGEGQAHGVPTAAMLMPDEALDTEQNRARAVFEISSLRGHDVRLPKTPVDLDGGRMERGAAGLTHDDARAQILPQQALQTRQKSSAAPLAGLRVLDMGVIVVGAETGRLLADAGAEVVKIENPDFPDGLRQSRDGSPMSQSFASGHRNKRSLKINLRDEEGKTIFRNLIAQADVLLSNFKTGTLESLGFDEATLRSINPALVSIESAAFGRSGPKSRQMGYGPLVRAATGLSALWAYPGDPGSFSDGTTIYPDHVAARIGALAALALLVRRRRTKVGGTASIAQAEVILDHLAVAAPEPRSHLDSAGERLPWGVFSCAGEDDWCVVTVENQAQRQRLADLIGFAQSETGKSGTGDALEQALRAWLAMRSSTQAMHLLQDAGIPAGAMLTVAEMPDFEHFAARGFFREVTNPMLRTPFLVETRPVKARHLPDPDHAPAPMMGHDSEAVLREWLGSPKGSTTQHQNADDEVIENV